MLVSYPLCGVYNQTTKRLEYIECPDLKIKFFLDESIAKLSLAKITEEVEKRIVSHLEDMRAAGFSIEPPRDLSYYRQQHGEKNRFWFEQSLIMPDHRGFAERIFPIGGFMLSILAGSLMLFMVLASSQLTFNRLGRTGSLLMGMFSALNTFAMMLMGYFLLGGKEMAEALGSKIDSLFKRTPDKEELLRIIAVKPEVAEEKALAVRAELQHTADEEIDAVALAQTQSLSTGASVLKYSATLGLSGLFLVDIGLRSMTTYQVLYRVGNAAFSPELSENMLIGLAGIGAGVLSLDLLLLLGGMVFTVSGDMHDYLVSKEQAQKSLERDTAKKAIKDADKVIEPNVSAVVGSGLFSPQGDQRQRAKSSVLLEEVFEPDEAQPFLPVNSV